MAELYRQLHDRSVHFDSPDASGISHVASEQQHSSQTEPESNRAAHQAVQTDIDWSAFEALGLQSRGVAIITPAGA
eukprot:scaffold664310_cov67-Prasinocladus_malaysianus.AAC.1